MVLCIKHYKFTVLKKALIVESIFYKKRYKLIFSITRYDPFSYIKPIYRLLLRKFAPKYYFKHYKDNAGWHMCQLCDRIGFSVIEGIPVCENCKKEYD